MEQFRRNQSEMSSQTPTEPTARRERTLRQRRPMRQVERQREEMRQQLVQFPRQPWMCLKSTQSHLKMIERYAFKPRPKFHEAQTRQTITELLQSLRQKADSFPVNSKSDYFLNKLLATLNLEDSNEAKFQQQLDALLTGLQFDTIKGTGPLCRQKKPSLRYYRCFDCERNGILASFCEQCFQEEIHKEHIFKLYSQPCYCDCGDQSVLGFNTFCKKHRDFTPSNQMTLDQYSAFYDCFQFLFFLSFELNSLNQHKLFGDKIVKQILQKITANYLQDSYEYKKLIAKLLFSPFRENYQTTQKCILEQILRSTRFSDYITKIIFTVYQIPSYRANLIQKYWNYYACNKFSSYLITEYKQIAHLLLSEVGTIISLLQEQKIAPIDLKCLEQDQKRLSSFFEIHKIMKNHSRYAQFIELTQVQFALFKEENKILYIKKNTFDKSYSDYIINIVKALSKTEGGIATLKKLVNQTFNFIKLQTKKDAALQRYKTRQARICFSIALFALYKFQTNLLEQQKLKNFLQLFGEQTELYLLVEQNYEQLLQISLDFQKLNIINTNNFLDAQTGKTVCLIFLQLKIFLILQAKIQQELKYDMLEFKFEADIINNGTSFKTLSLYINMMYAIEADFYEIVIANELGYTQTQKVVHFLKMLMSLLNREDKLQFYITCRDWIQNFNQLRMSGNYPQLYSITQPEESLYYDRVSFTSPFVPKEDKTKFISVFNMKKNNTSQRSNLSKHFFSEYLAGKMQTLFDFICQRFKDVVLYAGLLIGYLNLWLKLNSLLYLETKTECYQRITLKIMQKFQKFIFTPSNIFLLHSRVIEENIGKEREVIYQQKKLQQTPKPQNKQRNEKKEKMMSKIKQMQHNYIKKIDLEKIETKEEEQSCLICKMPDNLVMLCNAVQNQFLYSNKFGYKKSFLMITTCGHLVHEKCIAPKQRYNRRRNGRRDEPSKIYFLCQLCKKQANLIIPLIQTCNLAPEVMSTKIQYMEEDIQFIMTSNRQAEKNSQQQQLHVQGYEFDQLLFESILFSLYFFFTSHSKFFKENMVKVIKNMIAFLRQKLHIKGINIRPLNIHTKDMTFKNLQQMLALLTYHKESVRDKMALQIQQKIEQISNQEIKPQATELLKLFLWLLGKQKYQLSLKNALQNLNLFNLPKDLIDLNKTANKCETCNRVKSSNLPNLTNQIFICLMCGLRSCSKCQKSSKKLHLHQDVNYNLNCSHHSQVGYNLNCQYGTLNGFYLYTDQFGIGPQKSNEFVLKARGLYKLNQNNYQKVLNCLISSKIISNRMNYYNDRQENYQFDFTVPYLFLPRNYLLPQRNNYDELQYDWATYQDQRSNRRGRGRPRWMGRQRRERPRGEPRGVPINRVIIMHD